MHFTISPTGLSPPTVGLPRPFGYHDLSILKVLQPRTSPVWALPTSLAATTGIDLSFFSSRYLDVSVPRVPHAWLWIHHTLTEVLSAGFPHSDISGSQDMCSSPKLFAAYHVLHRLSVPRHPPCALPTLTVVGTVRSFDPLIPH